MNALLPAALLLALGACSLGTTYAEPGAPLSSAHMNGRITVR